jgi:sulfur relay (sulfurtransferase) complex TusBCD TusD component (DsrE family)
MMAEGQSVSLFLLQEAVRFCQHRTECENTSNLQGLIEKDLVVVAMTCDAKLRGISVSAANSGIQDGSYTSLVDLMTSCDRVVGIL